MSERSRSRGRFGGDLPRFLPLSSSSMMSESLDLCVSSSESVPLAVLLQKRREVTRMNQAIGQRAKITSIVHTCRERHHCGAETSGIVWAEGSRLQIP